MSRQPTTENITTITLEDYTSSDEWVKFLKSFFKSEAAVARFKERLAEDTTRALDFCFVFYNKYPYT